MTSAIVVLLLVAVVVALSIVHPGRPAEFPGATRDLDRDADRQRAELRAIGAHQVAAERKADSAAASASTSLRAASVSG